MEASKLFCDLINKIENCGLNYKIIKTPFSANISIKSSFVKYNDDRGNSEMSVFNPTKVKVTAIEDDLKIEQNVKLSELLKNKKIKVKTLEDEAGKFRDEILNIKKEKNTLNLNIKTLQTEIEELNEKKVIVDRAVVDLENTLKVKNETAKATALESLKLKEDTLVLEKQLDEYILELETLKKQKVNDKQKEEYKCSHCDLKFGSLVDLREHVRIVHFKNQVSQTKTIRVLKDPLLSDYPCFYCGKIITSDHDLDDHKPVCYQIKDFAPYPCDICGAQCPEEESLGMHRTAYHGTGTFSENRGMELFWCDMCPINFRNSKELDDHFRNCHG